MMPVIIFAVLAGLALLSFTRTPDADKPLAQSQPMPSNYGVPVTLALLAMILMLFAGLMGNSIEGSAYATVEAAGDADLMNTFIFSTLIGCVGGLMIVNGIARGLGVVLLLVGILGSVGVTELVR
jgi:hypothetical protein